MTTQPVTSDDHFEGLQNIFPKNPRLTDADLATILQAIRVDQLANEAEQADMVQMEGSAACHVLTQSGQPTSSQTLVIGADTYEAGGSGSNINFAIAGTAEGTLDNLLAAAQANGTELLKWDKLSATQLRLRSALTANGTVIGGDPSIAVTNNLSNWAVDAGAVNFNTLAGVAAAKIAMAATKVTITTAMVTTGTLRIAFPFAVRVIGSITALTSAGAKRIDMTDTFVISGNDILVTLNGGANDLANTDVLHIAAYK